MFVFRRADISISIVADNNYSYVVSVKLLNIGKPALIYAKKACVRIFSFS